MVFQSCTIINFVILVLPISAGAVVCSGQYERSTTSFIEGYPHHALLGHTIHTIATTNPQTCHYNCFMECRCLSYQISNASCELLDEDRVSKPASFQVKSGYKYYDITREYYQSKRIQDGQSSIDTGCDNGCCKSQPCLNNGRCKELCENPRLKFNCTCPEGYTGKLCQIKPRSCKDYLVNGTNGKYVVFDKSGKPFAVTCDFHSERGFAWTLIESFSFQNNFYVKFYPFFKDRPLNEANPNWHLYRLSFARMKDIADKSTYFRATCQFPVEGVKYVDYVRGKLSDTKVTDGIIAGCAKYDYVNIRGHQCHNCTAHTGHGGSVSFHLHIDGFYSKRCTLGQVPDALSSPGDDNFGYYYKAHSNHRCTSDQSATTQWWLGGP